jgi:hypothetical protein
VPTGAHVPIRSRVVTVALWALVVVVALAFLVLFALLALSDVVESTADWP